MRIALLLVVATLTCGSGCRYIAGYGAANNEGGPSDPDGGLDGPSGDLPPPPTLAWGHALGHVVGDAQAGGVAVDAKGHRYVVGTFSGRLAIDDQTLTAPEGKRGLFVHRYRTDGTLSGLWGLGGDKGQVLVVRDVKFVGNDQLVIAMQATGTLDLGSGSRSLKNNAGVLLWVDPAKLIEGSADQKALKPAIVKHTIIDDDKLDVEIWALAQNDSYLYAVGERRPAMQKTATQGFVNAYPLASSTKQPWQGTFVAAALRAVAASTQYLYVAVSAPGKLSYVRVGTKKVFDGASGGEHLGLVALDLDDGTFFDARPLFPPTSSGWVRGVGLVRGAANNVYLLTQASKSFDLALQRFSYSKTTFWDLGTSRTLESHGEVEGRLDLIKTDASLIVAGDIMGGPFFTNTSASDHIAVAVIGVTNDEVNDKATAHIGLAEGLFGARVAADGSSIVLAGSPKAGPFSVAVAEPTVPPITVPPKSVFWTEWGGAPTYKPLLNQAEGGMGTVRVEASALDRSKDRLVVAGSFTGTVDFDRGPGSKIWRRSAAGRDGFVAVYGSVDGSLLWVRTISSPQDLSIAALAVEQGRVLALGRNANGEPITVEGLPPSTVPGSAAFVGQWSLDDPNEFQLSRPIAQPLPDAALAIAARGARVVVAGHVKVPGGTGLALISWETIASDPIVKELSSPDSEGLARSLRFLDDSTVLLAGAIRNTERLGQCTLTRPQGRDGLLAAFTVAATGTSCSWVQTYGGPGDDELDAVAVMPGGDLLIAGRYRDSVDLDLDGTKLPQSKGGRDGFVARLDPSGAAARWAQVLSSSTDLTAPLLLDVDPGGELRVGTSYAGSLELGTLAASLEESADLKSLALFAELHGASGTPHWRRDLQTVQDGALTGLHTRSTGATLISGRYHGRLNNQGAISFSSGRPASLLLAFDP
jgi:hypothetical protein